MSVPADHIILLELCSFAERNDAKGSLLLIYTDKYSQFIRIHSGDIESRYVTVSAHDLVNSLEE